MIRRTWNIPVHHWIARHLCKPSSYNLASSNYFCLLIFQITRILQFRSPYDTRRSIESFRNICSVFIFCPFAWSRYFFSLSACLYVCFLGDASSGAHDFLNESIGSDVWQFIYWKFILLDVFLHSWAADGSNHVLLRFMQSIPSCSRCIGYLSFYLNKFLLALFQCVK